MRLLPSRAAVRHPWHVRRAQSGAEDGRSDDGATGRLRVSLLAQRRLRRHVRLRAALARRPRAPHRTPRQHEQERRPGWFPSRRSQLRRFSPSTALVTAGAGARLAAVSPSRGLSNHSRLHTRWAGLRTGIAAGHHRADPAPGHCTDPRGDQRGRRDQCAKVPRSKGPAEVHRGAPEGPPEPRNCPKMLWRTGGTPV